MPSPLGHAIGGAAAMWALAPVAPSAPHRSLWRLGAWGAVLGMLPDLDLLLTAHRAFSHSLGTALIVGLAAASLSRSGRLGVASAAAYATHTLFDWLGADSSAPFGVMALWPVSEEYYWSGLSVFASIWRRRETPDFYTHNIEAVLRELLILGPLAAAALWGVTRRARRRGTPAA